LSLDVWVDPPKLVGDWGREASIALLGSLTIYAGLACWLSARIGRPRRTDA
jgi:hypothetical protein